MVCLAISAQAVTKAQVVTKSPTQLCAVTQVSIAAQTAQAQAVVGGTEEEVSSPTEGVINDSFVEEDVMKDDLLQMLARFMTYVKNDYQEAATPNSINETCGYFKGENTAGSNEQGVRPNADLSMICAFLYKYGKDKVTLPAGITWSDINNMARKSLIFAYSTHKANKLKTCAGGDYWGSTSTTDHVWESSLWAMSVAYSAFFQYDSLTAAQKQYVYNLIKAECNYELNRSIPTGYISDTKAEENGWETNILSWRGCILTMSWLSIVRTHCAPFAIMLFSLSDATDAAVVDPNYNTKR
jgi:hypothetical protein